MGTKNKSRMRDAAKRQTERDMQGDFSNVVNVGDNGFFSVSRKGTKSIDIIPYRVTVDNNPQVSKGELFYERTYYMHPSIGPNEDKIGCPLKTSGLPCPICEYRSELLDKAQKAGKGGDGDALREQAKALKPKRRKLYNIIDLDEDGEEIKIWDVSPFLFGDLLAEELKDGPDENYDFAELKGGRTLKVRFKADTFAGREFFKATRVDLEEREEDYDKSILEDTVDLDKAVSVLGHKEIYQLFHGLTDEDMDDSTDLEPFDDQDADGKGDEPEPQKKSSKKKGKKKEEPEPEPEPEPECPFSDQDYTFGESYDEEDSDCEECDLNDACKAKSEGGEDPVPEPSKRGGGKGDGECPKDHEFGLDCDKHDECDDCPVWSACDDLKQKLKKDKKGKK